MTAPDRAMGPCPEPRLEVDVAPEFAGEVDRDLLTRVVCATLESQGITGPIELSVVVTNDARIQELNREYRGKDYPTDVLSFSQIEGPDGFPLPSDAPRPLGDIVISYDRVRAQAGEYGHSQQRELAYLTVHGLLHLIGFDHEAEQDRQRMRAAEESALAEVPRV